MGIFGDSTVNSFKRWPTRQILKGQQSRGIFEQKTGSYSCFQPDSKANISTFVRLNYCFHVHEQRWERIDTTNLKIILRFDEITPITPLCASLISPNQVTNHYNSTVQTNRPNQPLHARNVDGYKSAWTKGCVGGRHIAESYIILIGPRLKAKHFINRIQIRSLHDFN